MKNEHPESNKMLLSTIVGGLIGMGIMYSIYAARNHKTPAMQKLGKTISEVGEMLQNCDSPSDLIKSIENKAPTGRDMLNSLSDWVGNGFSLWKTLKRR